MRNLVRLLFALALIGALVAACGGNAGTPADIGAGIPAAAGDPAHPFGLDPAATVTGDFRRSGGFAGFEDHAQLFMDGHVELARKGREPISFQLDPAEVAQIDAAFDDADFLRRAPLVEEPSPGDLIADGFQFEITRRGVVVQSTLRTADGAVPEWAQSLIGLLSSVLLQPDRDRRPPVDDAALARSPVLDDPANTQLVVFARRGGPTGEDQRVVVLLDRTYKVYQAGAEVLSGQLTREEMADLLGKIESAKLNERQGEYLPEETCCDRFAYDLAYRNFFGAYQVHTMDGAVPEWFEPIVDTLVSNYLAPELLAAASLPIATPAVAAEETLAVTEETPVVAAEETPAVAAEETPAIVEETPAVAAEETPAIVEETPAVAAEETPAVAAEETPAAVEETPAVAAEETPVVTTEETPAIAEETAAVAAEETPAPAGELLSLPGSTSEPSPTPTAEPSAVPVPTVTPSATAAIEPTPEPAEEPVIAVLPDQGSQPPVYALADLLLDLASHDMVAKPSGGRIVKPYLATPGRIVQVFDQPIQVFEYPDEVAMQADLETLVPDASAIAGLPLTWSAPPHFWSRGRVLVIAPSDSIRLVDSLSQIMGEQFAGR